MIQHVCWIVLAIDRFILFPSIRATFVSITVNQRPKKIKDALSPSLGIVEQVPGATVGEKSLVNHLRHSCLCCISFPVLEADRFYCKHPLF